jgi:hypothetical protein
MNFQKFKKFKKEKKLINFPFIKKEEYWKKTQRAIRIINPEQIEEKAPKFLGCPAMFLIANFNRLDQPLSMIQWLWKPKRECCKKIKLPSLKFP